MGEYVTIKTADLSTLLHDRDVLLANAKRAQAAYRDLAGAAYDLPIPRELMDGTAMVVFRQALHRLHVTVAGADPCQHVPLVGAQEEREP